MLPTQLCYWSCRIATVGCRGLLILLRAVAEAARDVITGPLHKTGEDDLKGPLLIHIGDEADMVAAAAKLAEEGGCCAAGAPKQQGMMNPSTILVPSWACSYTASYYDMETPPPQLVAREEEERAAEKIMGA